MRDQIIAVLEMGIEPAVGQPGALHKIGNAEAFGPPAAQGARRLVENARANLGLVRTLVSHDRRPPCRSVRRYHSRRP